MIRTFICIVQVLCAAVFATSPCAQSSAPTKIVSGRVVDLLGQGLPNARVWASESGVLEPAMRETRTDGEGWFRLSRVPDRSGIRVHAAVEGRSRAAQYMPRDGTPLWFRLPEAAVLTGVVRSGSGDAAAGVTVWAQPTQVSSGICARATTDTQGRFSLSGVPLGHNRVFAWLPGVGLATVDARVTGNCEVKLDAVAGSTTTLTVTVHGLTAEERGRTLLRGGYPDVESLPEQPAPFVVCGLPEGPLRCEHMPDVRTLLYVESSGLRFEPSFVELLAGKGPHEPAFVVRRPTGKLVDVRAHVVTADGKSVADVPLALYGVLGQPPQRSVTDAQGLASFTTLREATKPLTFLVEGDLWLFDNRATGAGLTHRRAFEPSEVAPVKLEIARGAAIHGRLLQADGSPAAGTKVEFGSFSSKDNTWRRQQTTYTGLDGAFALQQLPISAHSSCLRVSGPNGSLEQSDLMLAEPGIVLALGDLRLTAPAIIEGVVQHQDDSVAIGTYVELRVSPPEPSQSNSPFVTGTTTDSQGRYRFVGVPPGNATLMARPPELESWQSPRHFVVEAGQRIVRDLKHPTR